MQNNDIHFPKKSQEESQICTIRFRCTGPEKRKSEAFIFYGRKPSRFLKKGLRYGIITERLFARYSNFAKQFKTQFGKTCKEYIEFIRICKADTLLLYTDKPVTSISVYLGYSSPGHFSRVFRTGVLRKISCTFL